MSLVLRAKYESGFISSILSKATSLRLHSAGDYMSNENYLSWISKLNAIWISIYLSLRVALSY